MGGGGGGGFIYTNAQMGFVNRRQTVKGYDWFIKPIRTRTPLMMLFF